MAFGVRDVGPFRADPAHGWAALYAMTELFRDVAVKAATCFGFDDPWSDDRHAMAHPRRVEDRAEGRGYRS